MTEASTPTINRQWLLTSRPEGLVNEDNFAWVETELPPLEADSVRIRNIYISLDPAQRGWMSEQRGYRDSVQLGNVMEAATVGVVVASNHDAFAVGDFVNGTLGWQEYATVSGKALRGLMKVPRIPGLPLHVYLGPLGHIGLTAYFGLLDIGQPKVGDTLVVSAAAGATGSLVGQIGKIKGCRVVGIAGSDDKCQWITETLGFDAAINYKKENVFKSLRQHCPDGIDVYFDNVGGDILNAALALINNYARIVACGMISVYNATEPMPGPSNIVNLIPRRARMQGFIVTDYYPRMMDALPDMQQWMLDGQLQFRVDLVEGLEHTVSAYNKLFTGGNEGKLLVQVSEEPAG